MISVWLEKSTSLLKHLLYLTFDESINLNTLHARGENENLPKKFKEYLSSRVLHDFIQSLIPSIGKSLQIDLSDFIASKVE